MWEKRPWRRRRRGSMGQNNLGSHSYKRFFYHLQFHKQKNTQNNLCTVFLDLTYTKGSGSCEFWQICSLFFALLLTNNPSTHSNTSDTQNVHTHFTSSTMLVKISQTQRSWENTKTFFSLASNYNTLKTSGFGGSEQGSGRSWREER